MYPALLQFPHISSYPVLLLAGYFGGYLLTRARARQIGLPGRHVDNLILILLVTGVVGARFFARWFYLPGETFWSAWQLWKGGGLVFYGGFLAGIISALLYAWFARIKIPALLDLAAPGVALGLALGRVGCFLAGCCWGDLCVSPTTLPGRMHQPEIRYQVQTIPAISRAGLPWAVEFPQKSAAFKQHQRLELIPPGQVHSLPVHPVQLYEALLALILCWAIHRGLRGAIGSGLPSLALLLGYAWIRFLTEFLRADNKPVYGELTFSQVVSGVLMLASVLFLIFLRRGGDKLELSIVRTNETSMPRGENLIQPAEPAA